MRIRLLATASALLLVALAGCDGDPSTPVEVGSVQLSSDQLELQIGGSIRLEAIVRDAKGRILSGRTVWWTSDDETVAVVDATGLVTAIGHGWTTVAATVEGKRGTAQVTVVTPQVASVDVDPPSAALREGETAPLTATPRDAQGQPVTGLFIQWISSDPDVASVSVLGVVTALKHGSAAITATVHGKSAEVVVTVTADYDFDLLFDRWAGTGAPELFLLDLAGGTPQRIEPDGIGGGTTVTHAAASPDGSRIAFASVVGNWTEIFVMDRDGGGLVQLTADGNVNAQPAWSPDGYRIAYVSWPQGSSADIWVMDTNGGNKVKLTADQEGGQYWPAWSPDGSRIVYSRSHGGLGHIWTMAADGGDKDPITTRPDVYDDQPSWSPDNSTIVFQRTGVTPNANLWLVNPEGGDERPLIQLPLHQRRPAWSPDGRLIAFASGHRNGEESIYTVWSDGTRVARRTAGVVQDAHAAWIARPAP